MVKNHGSQIKDDKTYEAIRDQGASKEKAARIANAQARSKKTSGGKSEPAAKGGRHGAYEDWSKDDLYQQAKKVGIEGRSRMKKDDLIDALRHH
ncbi:MAG: Rho termination factor N-terminal domain-containing protein [Caenispirillum bisanense]|jgi:hypothetical protein|nr:Rho termination factor N-terminal domain-containing protein [Caenispirillum bisanense]MCA1973227.1 Rho termination factor N-terminal domain-containing protein [Caenispirillum sp.]